MSRISKVKIKKTGQEIEIIKKAEGDERCLELMEIIYDVIRSNKVKSMSVSIDCGDFFYTDFVGKYDSLSAGASLLQTRINEAWIGLE